MSKIMLTIGDGNATSTVSVETEDNLATLEDVVDDLIVPALRAAGFADVSIAQYIQSQYLPEVQRD